MILIPVFWNGTNGPKVVSIDAGGYRQRFLAKRNALVDAHLHLVPPIAQRIHRGLPPSFDLDDLLSTGYLALIHAATLYRPRVHGGAPFSAFARPRIRGEILNSFRRWRYDENTRPPLSDALEPSAAPMDTKFDERRLKKRLMKAIRGLPEHPKRRGRFISLAAKLAEVHEWREAAGHVEAIAEMRRKAA
jgi:RNA polymerase sigma factor (sigma-70 family)